VLLSARQVTSPKLPPEPRKAHQTRS